MAGLGSVGEVLEPWRTRTAPAMTRAGLGALALAVAGGLLIARIGSVPARLLGLAVLGSGVALPVVAWMVRRRRERHAHAALGATLMRVDPDLGRAALRALDLARQVEERPAIGSRELAELHVARVLGRAPLDALARRAERGAWRWASLGLVLALAGWGLAAADPFRLVEGIDVLLARDGVAPLPMEWFEEMRIVAEPPKYLGSDNAFLVPRRPVRLAVGSIITVRGLPLHDGRALVLSDGTKDAAFEADGRGGLVARWVVEDDVELRIGARFGAVLVPEPGRMPVAAIADRPPIVRLERAPATLKLLEHPRIPLHWEAHDDHGLARVELVLRSGEREERRALSKPNGPIDRGGIDLLARDPMLETSHVPVEVAVEALDDDPIRGPKWGRSATIVIVPPQVGELEAMRMRALLECRDALTDRLAVRVLPEARPDRRWFEAEQRVQRETNAAIEAVLHKDFGGVRIPGRVSATARGLLERIDAALRTGVAGPGGPARERVREATEAAVLGFDAVIDALGTRDTRRAAVRLGDVALEAAGAIELGRDPAERERAMRRFQAAIGVLEGGGRQLVVLGSLGLDLGEIVENGVGRVERAMAESDRHHARLAAEDLAARLRDPDPSFRSSGSGSMGGTEAGGSAEDGAASDAARQSAGLEQALEDLRREHASEMAGVEHALEDALENATGSEWSERLRALAARSREVARGLPAQASDPTSARSDAAQARSQAEGMAAALERGAMADAVESGRRTLDALDRARRRAREGSGEPEVSDAVRSAESAMRAIVREAEGHRAEQARQASAAAKDALQQAGARERRLGERARRLRESSESSEAPLPEGMLEKLESAAREMEGAASELERSRGGEGLARQRQAQRLLEMAQPESDEESESGRSSRDGRSPAKDGDVPRENLDERAATFRRRVTEGLRRKAPAHLREAVRRYTEGLLR